MAAELCHVWTEDRLRLAGALLRPQQTRATPFPVDALILVHGTGSNFYAPGVLETFGNQAAAAGLAALRINTRGHDGMTSLPSAGRSVRGGATYEHVAECVRDLRAWIQFLLELGYQRIGLIGHSMGGVKSAFLMATEPHPAVHTVTLVSSPRFNFQSYQQHPQADSFREGYARAEQAVAAGRHDELIAMTQPLPVLLTAAGIIEKYGPANRFDWAQLLPAIHCPVLYVLGTESPGQSIGFSGVPEVLDALARQHTHIQYSLVEGANTTYSQHSTIPFERTSAWWQRLESA